MLLKKRVFRRILFFKFNNLIFTIRVIAFDRCITFFCMLSGVDKSVCHSNSSGRSVH